MSEKESKHRRLPRSLRIDMTPMVDLGFLLITFFIFTTTMAEPKTMSLSMPRESGLKTDVKDRNALTVLLDEANRVFIYEGRWEKAKAGAVIASTTYHSETVIGQWIRNKQKKLDAFPEGRDELVYIIKPTENASYANLIDAIDEASVNGVSRYVVVQPGAEELDWLRKGR